MAEREEKVPYYEQVANKLIEQLQAGTAPWQKPWAPGSIHLPHNPVSGTRYKGSNVHVAGDAGQGRPALDDLQAGQQRGRPGPPGREGDPGPILEAHRPDPGEGRARQAAPGRRGQQGLPHRPVGEAQGLLRRGLQRRADRGPAAATDQGPRLGPPRAGRGRAEGLRRRDPPRPAGPRLLPARHGPDSPAGAGQLQERRHLLRHRAPRAGPLDRPSHPPGPGPGPPLRQRRLRQGGAPRRDRLPDDRRPARHRPRPRPARRLRQELGPGPQGGPQGDPARLHGTPTRSPATCWAWRRSGCRRPSRSSRRSSARRHQEVAQKALAEAKRTLGQRSASGRER